MTTQLNEHLTLACDADGVLVHFEKKVCEITGFEVFNDIPRGKVWSSIGYYDKTVGPFFESLEKMPDADVLVDFIRANFINHFILTACGYTPKNAAEQKRNWFRREYGHDLVVKTVQGSFDKAAFATPTTILIDDRPKSIDPWVAAGGIGILHTSVPETIARLQEVIREHAAVA
jgi:hypothetical protein